MRINRRTAEMLEWPQFLNLYATFVSSAPAREKVGTIKPVEKLEEELRVSAEALLAAQKDVIPSLQPLEEIRAIIRKTTIENNVADGIELYRIYRLAGLNNEIRNRTAEWKNEFPRLYEIASRLPNLRRLEEEIAGKIEPTGEVKEDATPELVRIGRQIATLKSKVERSLERYFRDSRYRNALQEEYVTNRHGRAVLVVRSELKNVIRGIIHGESGSSASVFVEPFPVMELNNEIAQTEDRRRQEIHRILKELTSLCGREADALIFAFEQLIQLDLLFARGRFGKAFRCVIPEISDHFEISLQSSRHPLLEASLAGTSRHVVPFTLVMEPEQKALVVTGPNTGGKTVFLKTTGLLCLMAHCALPVPANEGTLIPGLSTIHADIGDQQSITESLSTFSSHITNIVSILSQIEDRSLILLDELGTGTDPEEGAPLAISILQELLKHEVKVLITSHHSATKMFAFNHPEAMTAAMEFDRNELQPTYRILLDQIGASHGLDMAQRLGMPGPVLERARALAGETQKQVEEFQARLSERLEQLEDLQTKLENEQAEWKARSEKEREKIEALQTKLQQQIKTLREENEDLIRSIEAKAETSLERIRDAETRRQLRKEWKEEVTSRIDRLEQLTATQEEPKKDTPHDLKPGDRVWVSLYRDFGDLVSIGKGVAELIIHNKRFQVPVSMLEKKQSVADALPQGVKVELQEKHAAPEINLIGHTIEDALIEADKYLDDAFLSQLPEVRIIHGHGTGRLKKALHDWLRTHAHVRNFRAESPQRGGTGVTVVELKY